VNIVEHRGVHLWRPAVPPARRSGEVSTRLDERL
jgi:hypothetical protein